MCEKVENANEVLAKLSGFIDAELGAMKENIASNYKSNMDGRKNNPFLYFSKDISKYMALGRSVDSQLGNRIQRIAFYMARMRYGTQFVPNIILITPGDNTSHSVKLNLYSVDCDIETAARMKAFTPFNQIIIIGKDPVDEQIRKSLKIKSKYTNVIKKESYMFNNVSKDTYDNINNYIVNRIAIKIPVDLLLFKHNDKRITGAEAYEIKMGGNLDTKNAKSNAEEVKKLRDILSFIPDSQAYFATCYGTCSTAVSDRVSKILSNDAILNGEAFWKHIIPTDENSFEYNDFIEVFKESFEKSELENMIKSL